MKKIKEKMRKVFLVVLCLVFLFLLAFLLGGTVVKASSGLVDETVNDANLYSRYDLDNYQLDFYVDTSWSWLPWHWMDAIGRSVMYGLYSLSDVIWGLSKLLSTGTGMVVQEAYKLDFISDMAEQIGKNIQTLAGVSSNGISSEGFYLGLLPWIIIVTGLYVIYVGAIKRETSKAINAVVSMLAIFILTTVFIVYAPTYIGNINEFSSDVSTAALTLGTKMAGVETGDEPGDSVNKIRDSLFSIQIYQPWLILQYGTSDTGIIGESRIQSLLETNPEMNYGADREAVVIAEIETYANVNMTVTNVVKRLGMVLFVFLLNLIISIFVMILAGLMLLSQVLFIIHAMFLPISFVLAMFPTYGSLAKKAVVKVFNIIMMRAGLTLIVTIAFSISTMLYGMSGDYPFLLVAFLQIVVFVGITMKSNELLGMMSLQEDGARQLQRRLLLGAAALPFMRANEISQYRRQKRHAKRRKRDEKIREAGDKVLDIALDGVGAAGKMTSHSYKYVKNKAEESLYGNLGLDRESPEYKKKKDRENMHYPTRMHPALINPAENRQKIPSSEAVHVTGKQLRQYRSEHGMGQVIKVAEERKRQERIQQKLESEKQRSYRRMCGRKPEIVTEKTISPKWHPALLNPAENRQRIPSSEAVHITGKQLRQYRNEHSMIETVRGANRMQQQRQRQEQRQGQLERKTVRTVERQAGTGRSTIRESDSHNLEEASTNMETMLERKDKMLERGHAGSNRERMEAAGTRQQREPREKQEAAQQKGPVKVREQRVVRELSGQRENVRIQGKSVNRDVLQKEKMETAVKQHTERRRTESDSSTQKR